MIRLSTARGAGLRKAPADAHRQDVADFAIGLKLLLAIAVGSGRIMGWPVFDVGCKRPRQFQRLVMRLRRQRDDEVEIEPFPILQFLEGGRLMARNILAQFGHHRAAERTSPPFRSWKGGGLMAENTRPNSAITVTANGSSSPLRTPADFT